MVNKFLYKIYNHFAANPKSFVHNVFIALLGEERYSNLMNAMETLPIQDSYKKTGKLNSRFKKGVVFMCDGRIYNTGLADRLRAICSVYNWCKNNNVDFYIFFNTPFKLSDYLAPNKKQWIIEESELLFNSEQASPAAIISFNGIFGEENSFRYHRKALDGLLDRTTKQIHLYSNTYCYDSEFYTNFHELFKFSDALLSDINRFSEEIGSKYVSVSFRFAQLLGDLKDTFGKPLPEDKKQLIMDKCKNSIATIKRNHPECSKVLVTSDSTTFISYISDLDYIYLLPGSVGHIANEVSEDVVKKIFWDILMISKAEKVYMIRTQEMFKSGFAKRAALIGNVQFEEVLI